MLKKSTILEPRANRREAGFSLLELLVALVILALIMGLVGPRVLGYLSRAKSQTALTQIENLEGALDLFLLDVGRYPTEDEGLGALIEAPAATIAWTGPYLDADELPADPWGHQYYYSFASGSSKPIVYSLGQDNVEGGDGEKTDVGL